MGVHGDDNLPVNAKSYVVLYGVYFKLGVRVSMKNQEKKLLINCNSLMACQNCDTVILRSDCSMGGKWFMDFSWWLLAKRP